MNTNHYFIITILLLIFSHYLYWKSDIGLNSKFQTLINIWVSLSLISYIYLAYISNLTFAEQLISTEVSNFSTYFDRLYNDTINIFIGYPTMNYYYNELFNNIELNINQTRNTEMENQISNIILSNIENIINYLVSFNYFKLNNKNIADISTTENKLFMILTQFFKSPIFIENWKKYKNKFANSITIEYIQTNFNL
jgi:hypothetical protein